MAIPVVSRVAFGVLVRCMAHSVPAQARVHILTISDTRTEATDESGNLCISLIQSAGHTVVGRTIVPDDSAHVESACRSLALQVDAILLNGGTGVSPRDTTYEAVSALIEKRIEGFGELFRMLSFAEVGSRAMVSRAVAGVFGKTVLFSMPGSTKAVRLAMEKLICPELGHIVGEINK
jgi:molybdopterin adenylyltransferase